jgi:hypothetical protein
VNVVVGALMETTVLRTHDPNVICYFIELGEGIIVRGVVQLIGYCHKGILRVLVNTPAVTIRASVFFVLSGILSNFPVFKTGVRYFRVLVYVLSF